ncbi:hypothetical protein GCM10027299_21820 [Larkinella ripae]
MAFDMAPLKDKPTEHDAFLAIYERCKKTIHKASMEDAFTAAQDLFYAQYKFCYSLSFDGFKRRFYAKGNGKTPDAEVSFAQRKAI